MRLNLNGFAGGQLGQLCHSYTVILLIHLHPLILVRKAVFVFPLQVFFFIFSLWEFCIIHGGVAYCHVIGGVGECNCQMSLE